MVTLRELEIKALELRKSVLQMIYTAKTGHVGGGLSSIDILTMLFYSVLKHNPSYPEWPDRDRFILSKGHCVEPYYAILADMGYIHKEELATFCSFGSRLIGHPSIKVTGVEMNTGALGHGLSVGVGMALAGKMDKKDSKVYVLMGDGEQAEGSVWEAAMAAHHYKLGNLIAILDRNSLQISGKTEEVMKLDSLGDKWSSFGWNVLEVDGHDIGQLSKVFQEQLTSIDKPTLILASTVKGKGVSFMENNARWHHGVPDADQFSEAINILNTKLEAMFL